MIALLLVCEFQFAFKEWTRDIGSNQYTQLISSYAPLSTLVQLGGYFSCSTDLFFVASYAYFR